MQEGEISSMNRLNDLAGYFRRKDIENLKVLCRREAEENEECHECALLNKAGMFTK